MEVVKLNDFNYWDMIQKLSWYTLTQEVCNGKIKSHEAIENCANILINEFELTRTEIAEFNNFVVEKRRALSKRLCEWIKENDLSIMDLDDMWDLCAHIVGLGENMYYFVWDNPRIMYTIKKGLIGDENFEFIFDYGIHELGINTTMMYDF